MHVVTYGILNLDDHFYFFYEIRSQLTTVPNQRFRCFVNDWALWSESESTVILFLLPLLTHFFLRIHFASIFLSPSPLCLGSIGWCHTWTQSMAKAKGVTYWSYFTHDSTERPPKIREHFRMLRSYYTS